MNEPCPKCGEYHNNCYEIAELTDKEINPLWRYRKKGEFDQFSYVEWNDEDSFGYEITMFLPAY